MEKLLGEETWAGSAAMGKALVQVSLERHHMQQSADYEWLLEFCQELPLNGLDFMKVICTGVKTDMNLRSGRKMLELRFVLKYEGREAVPSCSSAEATGGLGRPLLVHWPEIR